MSDDEDGVENIRQTGLEAFIGCRLVDITQTDRDERDRGEPDELVFCFDNGRTITVPLTALGLHFEGDDEGDDRD